MRQATPALSTSFHFSVSEQKKQENSLICIEQVINCLPVCLQTIFKKWKEMERASVSITTLPAGTYRLILAIAGREKKDRKRFVC